MDVASLASAAAAALLTLLAVVHTYWALGGHWPGRDSVDLARKVIGNSDQMASAAACLAVALGLLLAAALVVASTGGMGLPAGLTPWVRWAARGVAAVFFLRAAMGLFAEKLDPRISGTDFVRLNGRVYNPLCFTLAALCGLAAA